MAKKRADLTVTATKSASLHFRQSKTAELACEQAHWEKGELARNHAFYSLSTSTGIINKAVNCQIDAGRGMYNEEMYKTSVTPKIDNIFVVSLRMRS
jgi:hypothetical protein